MEDFIIEMHSNDYSAKTFPLFSPSKKVETEEENYSNCITLTPLMREVKQSTD